MGNEQLNTLIYYHEGHLMRNQGTTVFKFLGNMYCSNLRRKNKYSFDSITWKSRKISFWNKMKLVFSDKYKKLTKDTKKSIAAGI